MAIENLPPTTPEQITADALGSFAGSGDARVREVMEALVRHLHAFIVEHGNLSERVDREKFWHPILVSLEIDCDELTVDAEDRQEQMDAVGVS